MRRILIYISIGLVVVGTVLSLISMDYTKSMSFIGVVALFLAAITSIISFYLPTKYVYYFKSSTWKSKSSGGYFLSVLENQHSMGNTSKVNVYMKNESGYEIVGVLIETSHNGNVMISANSTFTGKIVIS